MPPWSAMWNVNLASRSSDDAWKGSTTVTSLLKSSSVKTEWVYPAPAVAGATVAAPAKALETNVRVARTAVNLAPGKPAPLSTDAEKITHQPQAAGLTGHLRIVPTNRLALAQGPARITGRPTAMYSTGVPATDVHPMVVRPTATIIMADVPSNHPVHLPEA